jgi:hypothetical protein
VAVSMKVAVFWVAVPCSLVEVYQHSRGACCLQQQGATTKKTAIFKIVIVFQWVSSLLDWKYKLQKCVLYD